MQYYDPKENTKVSLIPKQLYPMHIKKVNTKEVAVRGKYKAKVYNIIYEIAEECKETNFATDSGEVNGSSFVGKQLYSTGIFMFLNPKPGDNFEYNNGANEKYLRFCETINVSCPTANVTIDGETREVKTFPELKESEMIGKPILGFVDIEEYVKDGETRKSFKVKDFTAWKDGKDKDFDMADLPF